MLRPIKPVRGELAHTVRQLYFADRVIQNADISSQPVQTMPGLSEHSHPHEHLREISDSDGCTPAPMPAPTHEQLLTLTESQRKRAAEMKLKMDEVATCYKKIRGCVREPRVVIPTVYEPFTDATCRCGKPSTIILFPCKHKSSCADCYRVIGHCPKCSAAYTIAIK